MTITESLKDGCKVLRLAGRFDFQARNAFQTAIDKAEQGGARHIILNLNGGAVYGQCRVRHARPHG